MTKDTRMIRIIPMKTSKSISLDPAENNAGIVKNNATATNTVMKKILT
jgi:hypothetical protein